MTHDEKAAWRKWDRERWEAVESFKVQELAEMSDERAREIICSLRLFAPAPPNPLNGMGLVEQQAVFHRRKSCQKE